MASARRRRRVRHRLRRVAVGVAVALLAGCGGDSSSGIERAQDLIADDDRFGTPNEAAESFARVAELLLEEGRRCTNACDGILAAAAWVQFVAIDVLPCRQPDVHDARVAVLDHLAAVQHAIDAGTRAPAVPRLPAC